QLTWNVSSGLATVSAFLTLGLWEATQGQTYFSPTSGPVGTSVTITGTGPKQTTKVTFDGKSATFTVIKDTEVTADVPTGGVTGKIAVVTKGGSASSATSFTVN